MRFSGCGWVERDSNRSEVTQRRQRVNRQIPAADASLSPQQSAGPDPNPASAFVKAAISLEVLFSNSEKRGINPSFMAQISEGCAHFLGDLEQSCVEIEKRVKELYPPRQHRRKVDHVLEPALPPPSRHLDSPPYFSEFTPKYDRVFSSFDVACDAREPLPLDG